MKPPSGAGERVDSGTETRYDGVMKTKCFVLILLFVGLVGCSNMRPLDAPRASQDEQQIKTVTARLLTNIENEAVDRFMEGVALDFDGNRVGLEQSVQNLVDEHDTINYRYNLKRIERRADERIAILNWERLSSDGRTSGQARLAYGLGPDNTFKLTGVRGGDSPFVLTP